MINFNEGNFETEYLDNIKKLYENGDSFKRKIKILVDEKWNFKNIILTTSCTHALEIMAMSLNIGIGDEVLIPSYTFVSTANAFVKFGASVKCIDSKNDHPNIDEEKIEENISDKTKALVVVHYSGVPCNIEKIHKICKKHNIFLLEDAAQAINSYYRGKPLGSFGTMSAFSFHDTKNIGCGEGGMLVINNEKYVDKANIITEKGTNRHSFLLRKIDKYEWIDKGSSYPMAELNAAFLYKQLEDIESITQHRKCLWECYEKNIKNNYLFVKNKYHGNYHIYFILFKDEETLTRYAERLKVNKISSSTHYKPLHSSKYYKDNFGEQFMSNSVKFSKLLLRLPLHNNLNIEKVLYICRIINSI